MGNFIIAPHPLGPFFPKNRATVLGYAPFRLVETGSVTARQRIPNQAAAAIVARNVPAVGETPIDPIERRRRRRIPNQTRAPPNH